MSVTDFYAFSGVSLTGAPVEFSAFRGKVVLIVNTASRCGFTPQFKELQELHETYHKEGLVVIGFPCNQFGNQESDDAPKIGEFCQKNYGVDFLMHEKVEVNGDNAHPVFVWLKSQAGGILGDAIKWNFTKFLVGKDGKVVARYAPMTSPKALVADIETALS